jgi:hypothetical protein
MLEYTNHRNKFYRIGLRIWGALFAGASLLFLSSFIRSSKGGFSYVGIVICVIFVIVGFNYLRQSLWLTAYDLKYQVSPTGLILTTEKGKEIVVDYKDIKTVEAHSIKEGMDYFTLHIVTTKYNLVAHIEGRGNLAYEMRDAIREYARMADNEIG